MSISPFLLAGPLSVLIGVALWRLDTHFCARSQKHITKSVRYDLLCTLIEFLGGRYFFGWWIAYALAPMAFDRFEVFRDAYSIQLPGLLGVMAYLVMFDFFFYWYHRLMHKLPLWAEHEFHHSATDINPLTGFRFHFLSYFFLLFFVILPTMVFFRLTPLQFLAFVVILNLFSFFAHSNWNSSWGSLGKWLFVSPRFHRVHHRMAEQNGNFGGTFVIWDKIFGTYISESDSFEMPVGLKGSPYSDERASILAQYLLVIPRFLSASRRVGFSSPFSPRPD